MCRRAMPFSGRDSCRISSPMACRVMMSRRADRDSFEFAVRNCRASLSLGRGAAMRGLARRPRRFDVAPILCPQRHHLLSERFQLGRARRHYAPSLERVGAPKECIDRCDCADAGREGKTTSAAKIIAFMPCLLAARRSWSGPSKRAALLVRSKAAHCMQELRIVRRAGGSRTVPLDGGSWGSTFRRPPPLRPSRPDRCGPGLRPRSAA